MMKYIFMIKIYLIDMIEKYIFMIKMIIISLKIFYDEIYLFCIFFYFKNCKTLLKIFKSIKFLKDFSIKIMYFLDNNLLIHTISNRKQKQNIVKLFDITYLSLL